MEYTASYIIRGNQALEERLRALACKDHDHLLEPQLWTNPQGGRTVWGPEDYLSAVKRLFVAHVRFVVLTQPDVERIFGDLPVHETSFDRWWFVEAFQGADECTADVIEELRQAGHADSLEIVGLPLITPSSRTPRAPRQGT